PSAPGSMLQYAGWVPPPPPPAVVGQKGDFVTSGEFPQNVVRADLAAGVHRNQLARFDPQDFHCLFPHKYSLEAVETAEIPYTALFIRNLKILCLARAPSPTIPCANGTGMAANKRRGNVPPPASRNSSRASIRRPLRIKQRARARYSAFSAP